MEWFAARSRVNGAPRFKAVFEDGIVGVECYDEVMAGLATKVLFNDFEEVVPGWHAWGPLPTIRLKAKAGTVEAFRASAMSFLNWMDIEYGS